MIKAMYGVALFTVLAMVPAPAVTQQQAPTHPRAEQPREMHKHGPPVGALLQLRSELQLTDAQVARLQAITQRLEIQNRPLVQQLRDAGIPVAKERRERVREMTPAQRQELRAKLEAHRPTLQQLRQNTQAAMHEAREVLTPEQQQRMRELVRERGEKHRSRHGRSDGSAAQRGT